MLVLFFFFSLLLCLELCFLGFPCFGFLFFLLSLFVMLFLLRRVPACGSLFPVGGILFLGFLWPGLPLSLFLLFPELMHQLFPDLLGHFILDGLCPGMALGGSFLAVGFLLLSFWLVRIGSVLWRGYVASFLVLCFQGPAVATGLWP